MKIYRSPNNPIIEPKNIKPSRNDFEVIGVFNAGVARFKDEVILLIRVAEKPVNTRNDIVLTAIYNNEDKKIEIKEFVKDNHEIDFSDPRLIITPNQTYLTSISHLTLARSRNGIDFEIENKPTIQPSNYYETFGIEDPRITQIGDIYYISYIAVCPDGVTTCLLSTKDFSSYQRHGVIFCPDNKDVVIFPDKINGRYYALHRPSSPLFGRQQIWISDSSDLISWGNHRNLMAPGYGDWDKIKIGAGAVPFLTEAGWLEIYHGVDSNNHYSLGAVLFDAENPSKIISRTKTPIMAPQEDYECRGFFGNVVFTCGLLCEDKKLKIYYGAADTVMCYAEIYLEEVLTNLSSSI